jgi:hypothetical protein
MTVSYSQFKNKVLGKGYDIDGYYGNQCWDGYAEYCIYLGYSYAHCTKSGYVKDIWELRKSNGMLNNFDEVEVMQAGDIAVFKEVEGVTPLSHIAIFDSDIDGKYGYFLGENQGATNGVFSLCKLPYSATYDTAFRPKKFASKTNTSTTKWDYNATLKVGDTVKSKSLAITGLSASKTMANIPDLGGYVPLSDISESSDTGDGAVDNYLANTKAKVYLDPCLVQAVNSKTNQVKVHGYWVNAKPLAKKVS